MSKQSNKLNFFNTRLTRIFLGSLLVGLPIFTVLEAKADNHYESMPNEEMGVERDETKPESGVYNDIDSGYDGEPTVTIVPTEGMTNVTLKNNTNAAIDYQAIGYTENQTLEGGEEHTLRELPLPVVIRMARQDDGFIKLLPLENNSEAGMLEVSLDEDPDYYDDNNIGVIRIEEDGGVYLN
ncbi:MAG TPA: hypothetical protein ACFCUY_01565 [Xenococcaceae cyanobacterium]